jgi:hypothetical protein
MFSLFSLCPRQAGRSVTAILLMHMSALFDHWFLLKMSNQDHRNQIDCRFTAKKEAAQWVIFA